MGALTDTTTFHYQSNSHHTSHYQPKTTSDTFDHPAATFFGLFFFVCFVCNLTSMLFMQKRHIKTVPTRETLRVSYVHICTHMNAHFTRFKRTANTQKQAEYRLSVHHIHLTPFPSLLLCLTLIQDRKSPSKAQFADCVLQAGFVIVSLHINILCLHRFFLPSPLLPPLHHPSSLPPSLLCSGSRATD